MALMDLTGKTFGRWFVINRVENSIYGETQWLCRCACGTERVVKGNPMRRGVSKSCGCLSVDVARQTHTKHGMHGTKEYKAWDGMIDRCTNPNNESYFNYGGRGIRVCDRWRDFVNFYADMGPSNGLTLDRRNNDGHYEPGNCRWADWSTQMGNKRLNPESKTGVIGVTPTKQGGYSAELHVNNVRVFRQHFMNLDDAIAARKAAEIKYRCQT